MKKFKIEIPLSVLTEFLNLLDASLKINGYIFNKKRGLLIITKQKK